MDLDCVSLDWDEGLAVITVNRPHVRNAISPATMDELEKALDAADDIRIGFTQVALAIMPAWGGAERLSTLVGRGRALLLAGAGSVLDAHQAREIGLIDQVLARADFDPGWRAAARSLASPGAREIKRVTSGELTATEAARAFARLWVADEHWAAAERMMRRG